MFRERKKTTILLRGELLRIQHPKQIDNRIDLPGRNTGIEEKYISR